MKKLKFASVLLVLMCHSIVEIKASSSCWGVRFRPPLKPLAKTIALKPSMIAFPVSLLILRDIGSHFSPVISTQKCRGKSSSTPPGRRLLAKNN
jgi:hypothetical protein